MRKVAYNVAHPDVLKLMIYEFDGGAYLFGYDNLADTACTWDEWYESIEEAEEHANSKFNVNTEDWIIIAEPCSTCKHDLITTTGVELSGRKLLNFKGLTGNERLYLSGLIKEFDKANVADKLKARRILEALNFDQLSITELL
ncbi:hypothetical protein ABDD95_14590 [Mucilaginibacter sp. PAMB04274]|uniref:hypothetical protein n=1 Tax=Mucilaginibacter sp. PAMB04274 TaxID=3138568 RepID=UPI00332645DF